MSATDKKQGINDYWREFGYDSDYESSLDKNKDNNSEEEQEEEENQYEEMENNGEEYQEEENEYEEMINQEEYEQNNEGNYYEEQEENGEEEVIENEEMEVENNYENADDQEMKKSSQDEWSKLFNDLDDINEDISYIEKGMYLEHALQDMESYTKILQNQDRNKENQDRNKESQDYQCNEEGEEYIEEENKNKETNVSMKRFNNERNTEKNEQDSYEEKYPDVQQEMDIAEEFSNEQEYNEKEHPDEQRDEYYDGENNFYNCQHQHVDSINYNPISVVKYKELPSVVLPQDEFHHGWQYYDEWKKSNKRNTALEQAAKDKLKDEIFTYYQYIPSKWKNLAKSAVLKGDLETMNKAINATFAKVTPL